MTTLTDTPHHNHRWPILWVVLAVLCLHALLLSESPAWFSPHAEKNNPTLSFVTRQIETAKTAPPKQAEKPAEAATSTKHTVPHSTPAPPTAATHPAPIHFDATHPNLTAPVALPERAASAVDLPPFQRANSEGLTEPTAANAPASALLNYTVQGLAKGFHYPASAQLLWKNTQDHYEARLEVGAFLLGSRTQTSSGQLGREGLMPTRFGDKTRSELAVHFQREKGVISFSANTPEVPLLKGAQDRLSVVLQLSALFAGDPTRYPLGTMLSFQTVSQREAEVWQFKVDNEETLNLPYGDLPSIKLLRTPRRDFDQRIELWLAPSLGYLPVRLRITNANGDFVDQLLRSVEKIAP
ncbi:MAG: hypothetical protein RI902_2151 [Pseudomonadota bacterium]|jgi:hypothetical protein